MKFAVNLKKTDEFKKALDVMKEISPAEIRMKADSEGLHMVFMDAANVAMIVFDYKKDALLHYEVPESTEICFNPRNLNTVLKRFTNEEVMFTLEEDGAKLGLKGGKKSFSLPLLNIDEEDEKKLPDLEYKGTITVGSEDLFEAIQDVNVMSDSSLFSFKDGKFVINDSDKQKAKIEVAHEGSIEGEQEAKFSVEYLMKLVTSKLSEKVGLSLKKEYPIRIEYSTDNMTMKMILAPRVDND